MSTGYVMFVGILILIVVYIYVYRKNFGFKFGSLSEGFISYTVEDPDAKAACAPKTLIQNPMKPEVAQLGVGSIPPSKAVGDIPSSTYTPSRAASMPYRNTGTEPARYINILSALQQFQAFFGFEAPALESECSPTVVLPLQTARADMSQLQTQSDVLERNPGIPSTISSKELAVMLSNLRFLQKLARKFKANSGTELLGANSYSGKVVESFVGNGQKKVKIVKKSMDEVKNGVDEGFTTSSDDESVEDLIYYDEETGLYFDAEGTIYEISEIYLIYGEENILDEAGNLYSEEASASEDVQADVADLAEDEGDEEEVTVTSTTPATAAQLMSFKSAIETALTQLRSGTANATDPITLARVAVLDRLRRDVEQIIIDLDQGEISASEVPIYYNDIQNIANRLADTDKSIGTIIRNVSLPPVLAKLFPSDMNYKDKLTLSELSDDIRSYMDTLTEGMSWKASGDVAVEMKYDSQRAVDIAKANAAVKSLASSSSTGLGANASADPVDNTDYASVSKAATRGRDYEAPANSYNATSTSHVFNNGTSVEGYGGRPSGLNADGTRIILQDPAVGGFDWKGRAESICNQIKSRGMEPTAFGCVRAADVGSNYSWRGNVAMVCSRLEGTTDPGLPVSAGCPPKGWAGWKS